MRRHHFLAALAAIASPALTADRLVFKDDAAGIRVHARVEDRALVLTINSPAGKKVGFAFDRGDDGRIDPGADQIFTSTGSPSALCFFREVPRGAAAKCDPYGGRAAMTDKVTSQLLTRTYRIPVSEAALPGRNLNFHALYGGKGVSGAGWIRMTANGAALAASRPSAEAARPVVLESAPSPYGYVYGLRPEGGRDNFALGNEYKITGGYVTQPRKDIFSHYYLQMIVKGTTGDRFKFAWNSGESVSLEYDHDRGYDVQYPQGATIFDRSSSMTITLKRTGEHSVVFSQLGVAYPKGQSGGLAGPSLSGGVPRPFQTTYIKITKLP